MKEYFLEKHTCMIPSFHVVDNFPVVAMSLDPPLNFVIQKSNLKADDKTGHAEKDVAPKLPKEEP